MTQMRKWYPMLSFKAQIMTSLTWKTHKRIGMAALSAEFEQLKNYLKTVISWSPVDPEHPMDLYIEGSSLLNHWPGNDRGLTAYAAHPWHAGKTGTCPEWRAVV